MDGCKRPEITEACEEVRTRNEARRNGEPCILTQEQSEVDIVTRLCKPLSKSKAYAQDKQSSPKLFVITLVLRRVAASSTVRVEASGYPKSSERNEKNGHVAERVPRNPICSVPCALPPTPSR